MLLAECYSGLLKVEDDTVDLRKVLLCAVLTVVFNQRVLLSWKLVCVRVCVCPPPGY